MKGDMELDKDVRSIIPSRMKSLTTIGIQTGESLSMKGRTIVVTNQPSSDDQEGDGDTMAVCNHIIVCEVSTPEDEEVETSEASKSLEDGGQATVDGHKESNLGTEGEPRPVYVSALLSQEEENAKLRLAELEVLDEKRLRAQQKLDCYQARLSRAFNKKVRVRSFQVGDMVLAVRRPIITSKKTGSKFTSKWDGPYVVQEVYTNGAYKIVDADGVRVGPINGKFLKRYYP
ncbi:Gypsy retrotransposon integrase-like protein 1 [Bienertia sinuspersici]